MSFFAIIEDLISAKLEKLNEAINKPQKIMAETVNLYQSEIDKAFDEEQDPDNNSPWADLASSTKKRKKNPKKLQETGKGKVSVKLIVKNNEIYVQHEDYMNFHRTGTRKMPKRNFVPSIEQPKVENIAIRIIAAILKN